MDRGKLNTDTLVKIILVLVVIWLAIEVLETVVGFALGILSGLPSIIGLALVIILVLWILDYI